jgi:hypothetical protein
MLALYAPKHTTYKDPADEEEFRPEPLNLPTNEAGHVDFDDFF